MKSILEARGSVRFPEVNQPERHYMVPFRKAEGLPENLTHWQPTVDDMLQGIDTDGPIYLMVDRAYVQASQPHRRPGVHVDGYWDPTMQAHGGGHRPVPAHRPSPPTKPGKWSEATFEDPEAILLASSVTAAQAFVGDYQGTIGDMGDASGVDVSALTPVPLLAGKVYAGNVAFLHESLPVPESTWRTVVRLNVPGWTP